MEQSSIVWNQMKENFYSQPEIKVFYFSAEINGLVRFIRARESRLKMVIGERMITEFFLSGENL